METNLHGGCNIVMAKKHQSITDAPHIRRVRRCVHCTKNY